MEAAGEAGDVSRRRDSARNRPGTGVVGARGRSHQVGLNKANRAHGAGKLQVRGKMLNSRGVEPPGEARGRIAPQIRVVRLEGHTLHTPEQRPWI